MKQAGVTIFALLVMGCNQSSTLANADSQESVPSASGELVAASPALDDSDVSYLASDDQEQSADDEAVPAVLVEEPREPFDEDDAKQQAEDDLQAETYRSIGRPYGCTDDCSGHDAGFKYRARHGYGGRIAGDYDARSFRQGQQAYDDEIDQRVEAAREAYDDEEPE